jgi:hypothetical protein
MSGATRHRLILGHAGLHRPASDQLSSIPYVYFGDMPNELTQPPSEQNIPVAEKLDPEPRWPAVITIVAVGGLYGWLPERLTPGPSWLLMVAVIALLIPTIIAHRIGMARVNYATGLVISVMMTCAVGWSLSLLIMGLPSKKEAPGELLRAAAALWLCNIFVFATWYWRLDAGGPYKRDVVRFHTDGAFLFPQMTLPKGFKAVKQGWRPGFVDYLFLAFNTSTAFSPTDVPVLSRWAKCLMMLQSTISLGTLAILAARAINIL